MSLKEEILKDWKLFRPVALIDIASFVVILASLIVNYFGPEGNFVVLTGVIGNKLTTMKIIGTVFIMVFINSLFSFTLFKKERLLSWFLALAHLGVAILCLIKVASVVYFW
jgi:phosphoglycerol transferase MdoB-like AlkP superfamily enzyme